MGVLVISAVFVWYTLNVIESAADGYARPGREVRQALAVGSQLRYSGPELQFIFNEIIVKATFPIIVARCQRHATPVAQYPRD